MGTGGAGTERQWPHRVVSHHDDAGLRDGAVSVPGVPVSAAASAGAGQQAGDRGCAAHREGGGAVTLRSSEPVSFTAAQTHYINAALIAYDGLVENGVAEERFHRAVINATHRKI